MCAENKSLAENSWLKITLFPRAHKTMIYEEQENRLLKCLGVKETDQIKVIRVKIKFFQSIGMHSLWYIICSFKNTYLYKFFTKQYKYVHI